MTTSALHSPVRTVQLSLLAPEPLAVQALAQGEGDAINSIGWRIGHDHARFGVALPSSHLHEGSPLFAGWQAAMARRLQRHRDPAPAQRRWLRLRLQAWSEGLGFEEQLLTPHYLQQLHNSHCPVTREELQDEQGHPAERVFARLLPGQAYAAGHLVQLSRRAALALGQRSLQQLRERALVAARQNEAIEGLDAGAWDRLCGLRSLVEVDETAAANKAGGQSGPLFVLPTNRLRLQQPLQALQAWVTRQLQQPGWSQRLQALHDALPGVPARQAASSMVAALAPHALRLPLGGIEQRWALEDLWRDARVQRRWISLSELLSPLTVERLLRQLPPPPGWMVEQHAGHAQAWLPQAA